MKTSARNHLTGVVLNMDKGPVNDEVTILLDANGMHIVAEVDASVVKRLGIQTGTRVTVLIKTHDVVVVSEWQDVIFSPLNLLGGTIITITPSEVTAEVRVRLDGGGIVASTITMEAVKELALEVGGVVKVMVKASSIMLAVPREHRQAF